MSRQSPFINDFVRRERDEIEYAKSRVSEGPDENDENNAHDLDITEVVKRDLLNTKSFLGNAVHSDIGSDTEDEGDDEIRNYGKPGDLRILSQPKRDFSAEQDEVTTFYSTRPTGDTSRENKIGWSSEGEIDDEGLDKAYLAFKKRKSRKRKRATYTAKSSGAPAAQGVPNSDRRKNQSSNIVIGRRERQRRPAHEAVWKDLENDENTDPEDFFEDDQIPDYVRDRKAAFEKEQELYGTAGLKLPPAFDEIYFSDDDRIDDLLEKPNLHNSKPCAPYKDIVLEYSGGIIPAPIAQWLRDYQIKGVQFLHELFVWQRGGILGDDMGLGKTIQVISFLTAAYGKTGDERDDKRMRKIRSNDSAWYPRTLIVCPNSLIENWKAELDRWGWWKVYTFHGTSTNKTAALSAAIKGRAEIMITSYTTYRLNASAINTVDWDCVVADECHGIKGRQSEITKAMNDVNALCRIGLTGTAIQNNYEELWTLLNWTNPGRFGSLSSWKQSISEPLKIGQSHNASAYQLGLARRTAYKLVNNLLPQFFLRRMKSLIASQLPKKSDKVVFCPLTDTQVEAYENYVYSPIVEFIRNWTTSCACGSGQRAGSCCQPSEDSFEDWRKHVFPTIVTLQKISNHLALIIPSKSDSEEKQSKDIEHLKTAMPDSWQELYREGHSLRTYANPEFCGKWKILQKLLQYWHANGDKVLVFSHSVRLLKMLLRLFDMSKATYNVSYLDGSLRPEERMTVVDDFNTNPRQFVFLISTKAGGVGLNITSANKVVIMDPNWNPAYDLQAQDRAYRIGQTRDVEVFRMISSGTIEEIVYARQIYKQQQANIGYTASSERRYFTGVQNDKDRKGEIFGLANMFAYHNEGVRLQQIVNKTNVAESRLGVAIGDIDMSQAAGDDGDLLGDEDAAMRELESLIVEGENSKNVPFDETRARISPVQAILANAGVSYTHENSEVIGTSKTEARISRKAAEAAEASVDHRPIFDDFRDTFDRDQVKLHWKHNPPESVRRRQFCTMAKMFGFTNATEFALVVEGWTQEQRRNCLEKFYRMRREYLFRDGARQSISTMPEEDRDAALGKCEGEPRTDASDSVIQQDWTDQHNNNNNNEDDATDYEL
ncbi:uncharacterized protein PV09_07737 [Verruconis gallopava]|uniref:Uncharacterized protein n=1 Tax=Verruconis gallopava TaxID=253628 RepID=A0A0D1XEX1_9PEZI|nr:uncharacterized protein PV09_07737 [Verruconis gallopava]KIW00756.1 hypothetical protein PV09_07737 [Verruconis gallopava]